MGSSHSQIQNNNPSSSSSSSPPSTSSSPQPRRHSRLNSLRRLSTLGRRDSTNTAASSGSKRLRQGSATSDSIHSNGRQEGKKRARGTSPIFPLTPGTVTPAREEAFSPMQISETPTPEDQVMEEIIEVTSSSSIQPHPHTSPAQASISLSPPSPIQSNPQISSIPSATLPSPASIPLPTTPSSETSDLLSEERLRSLSTIRDALGPDWPSSSPTPAVERLFHRFRRSTSSPDLNNQSSSPSTPHQLNQRTMSDRLTALLGFSTPGDPGSSQLPLPSSSSADPTSANNVEENDETIEELTNRLAQAREELADTERQLNETRERMESVRNRRPPSGAVLIIQGLAQTHSQEPSEEESSNVDGPNAAPAADGRRRPGMRNRRSSEGSHTRHRWSRSDDRERDGASLETQARMIGGLLTVAAAATATTLLAPSSPPLPSTTTTARSPAASALESIVNRLRPRPNRAQSVEAALGNYLRTALQNSREGAQASPSASTTATTTGEEGEDVLQAGSDSSPEIVSTDFQRFLESVQGDLVGAVREFAGPLPLESLITDRVAQQGDAQPETPIREEEMREIGDEESFVTAPSSVPTPIPATPTTEQPPSILDQPIAGPSSSAIPSFHHQLGQTLPRGATGVVPQVTGGTNGQPRRLNFFRAHMFPPLSTTTSTEGSDDTAQGNEAIVPCIFIGVRSIRHNPNMTTDDLVSHPNFPFVDGQVPPSEPSTTSTDQPTDPVETEAGMGSTVAGSSDLPLSPVRSPTPIPSIARPTSPLPSSPPSAAHRTLRERVMDRLRSSTTRRPSHHSGSGPLNTYLVYVIGGNYPRNHPILSIPNLITGGPLTDEEMNLISELMGPAKPPTVDKEEIEKSGLKIVKGSEMEGLRRDGGVLDNCGERCLIYLSEYEPEDECRILNCRHGYHKECVDQWLSKGRNSCPACRSEAVDTTKTPVVPSSTDATRASSSMDVDPDVEQRDTSSVD
ncbi:hypothetical protein I302_107324 [Kwoniella bestiolae CBS 10118]|uniref:RING-type domain-containing protein n=1 Tax=Kwoniella bestiolae CBS 10118 TaxID=1296100 RepID=A0A1B9FYW3_9TREE|nr:hypothetical protein I302_06941 [Kwoniella bestiolae CBS 10118]OCF23955.1 hypothetical protein I302_06941 [Kwoniella bestiolae CBS 10118]